MTCRTFITTPTCLASPHILDATQDAAAGTARRIRGRESLASLSRPPPLISAAIDSRPPDSSHQLTHHRERLPLGAQASGGSVWTHGRQQLSSFHPRGSGVFGCNVGPCGVFVGAKDSRPRLSLRVIHQPPFVEPLDPVGPLGGAGVVGDQQDGLAEGAAELFEEVEDFLG